MANSLLFTWLAYLMLLLYPCSTLSVGNSDTITWGGDSSRAGYETTHNLDPQVVGSADFGNIWTATLPGNFNGIGAEQVLSQPLVYTTKDGNQYVFIATTQNNLYKIDAKTGDVVKSRNIGVPFMASELGGCNDIYPAIGVSGTGVIDPSTGLWYITSKTYTDQYQSGNFNLNNAPGRENGRYYFHAISTEDLSEAPNFPRLVHQTAFRNNKNRWLVAGDQHQRPALLQVGDYIYTGWASHCIQYNYTGAVIGFHKSTGVIVESYAMQGGLEPNTVSGGGVWMSGGGLAYDGAASMFFSTGNGYASQLPATGQPLAGPNVPTALEEAVVHMRINDDGTLVPVDFFMPWEKTQLDGADKDLGTTPFQLLPEAFSCPNDRRVGVITGKSGKTYFLNVDNLGGYQRGANRLDDAIYVYQNENSVYSAVGVMPIGRYLYVNVINYRTRVFQWSCNVDGHGAVTEVTTAAEKNAQAIGVGHGTTTSLDGRDGTGLYWMTDVEGPKLRVYDATPPSDGGPLKLLRAFNFGNPGKFSHPVFGDGKAFIGATGSLYAFGSPVNLPLNCSGPINFAKTSVNGTSDALPITCTANVATTITSFNVSGSANFAIAKESSPDLPLVLESGQQFSFQARFIPKAVGPLSSDVIIASSNAVAGASSSTPVTLSGTSNSANALFTIQPITVSFNSTIGAGDTQKSVFFNNDGDTAVAVNSIQFSIVSETGPWIPANTIGDGKVQVAHFTFSNLPSAIPANTRQTVGISYNALSAGNYAVFLKVSTNGGTKLLDIFGTTGSMPSALIEFQTPNGSAWVQYFPGQNFSFGTVAPGTMLKLQMRITNNGSNTASPLGLTVSKPPFGFAGFVKAANAIDLAEGTQIAAGQSANASVFCAPPDRQVNTPDAQAVAPWRINTNSDQGAFDLRFACNAVAPQAGPLLSDGSAQHSYIGCYQDLTPGRQLSSMAYSDDKNSAERCINVCDAGGYIYTGLSWARECWCGNALPINRGTVDDCNYRCTGDNNHTCGGDGIQHRLSMLDIFADSYKWDGIIQGPDLVMTEYSGNYRYTGCYAERGGKTFNIKSSVSSWNSVDRCRDFCNDAMFFGLQYGSECYCGSSIANTSTLVEGSECGMTCSGNNSQYCGAGSRMQVYQQEEASPLSSSSSLAMSFLSPSATGNTTTSSSLAVDTASTRLTSEMLSSSSSAFSSSPSPVIIPTSSHSFTPTVNPSSTVSTTSPGDSALTFNSSWTVNPTSTENSPLTTGMGFTSSPTFGELPTSITVTSTEVNNLIPSIVLKCPASNGATYIVNSQAFLIECGKDYRGNDMKSIAVVPGNLNACITACATTAGCKSVALSGAACYLKYGVGTPNNNGIWGARVITFSSTATSDLSSPQASSSASLVPTIWSSNPSIGSTTAASSLSPSNQLLTSSIATSEGDPAISSTIFSPPSAVSSTTSTTVTANSNISSTSVVSSSTFSTLANSDFFSSSSTAMLISGASLTNTSTPESVTSSSSLSTPPTTVLSTTTSSSTAITSTTISSTVTEPIVAPTAGLYYSLGCYGEPSSGRALSEVYTNSTMTVEMCASKALELEHDYMGLEYGVECWMGDLFDTTKSAMLAPSRCNAACPGNKTTLCGSSNALQMYVLNSTLATPRTTVPEYTALACPENNDQSWTASTGTKFRIECGWDRTGGSSSRVVVSSFEACLEECARTTGCGSVALWGSNCYIKTGILGTRLEKSYIQGATLLRLS
ncbi:hypothetical protein OPT61_g1374 [Boeremia exigua]|uniref:Uncharacterized protein n=1 Tax=Boeremia exigua TaxID=749465 RepID=A0ACC2IQE7_9PLEO|nr:hypothetical protein OPT61_g1374 [Boeremia exigua]